MTIETKQVDLPSMAGQFHLEGLRQQWMDEPLDRTARLAVTDRFPVAITDGRLVDPPAPTNDHLAYRSRVPANAAPARGQSAGHGSYR
jgi:hypothetical protein